MNKLLLKTPKPRNPLVALARQRKAGAHRLSGGALRQREKQLLRLQFEHLPHQRP